VFRNRKKVGNHWYRQTQFKDKALKNKERRSRKRTRKCDETEIYCRVGKIVLIAGGENK
jgi:hypothetical protein